jgi:pilus retraction protein PilT
MSDQQRSSGAATVRNLLIAMESAQASDLFLAEGKRPSARIHGAVRTIDAPVVSREELLEFLDEVVTPSSRQAFDSTGDLDLGVSLSGGRRVRVNIARQRGTLLLVARAIPSGEHTFDGLGLPAQVTTMADHGRGLVLVTGATGSGKSTTLAAFIHHLNSTRKIHIVTIEDPIEFMHRDIRARVTQREVGTDTDSFLSALRHVVRQSPDVIVIGEMRDLDTMQVAIAAALTGHLVFATLHTIDVTQSLQRILTYYPEYLREQAAMDLSLCLRGILSQRLLPRLDGKGRALAAEMFTISPAAARLIRDGRIDELQDFMRISADPNLMTFNHSLLQLYKQGLISFEMGRAYATNPDEFALATQGMATGMATFSAETGIEGASGLDMKALLQLAISRGASDLHVTVGRPPILRISGSLEPLDVRPLSTADMQVLLYSILNTRQRTAFELERELDFALSLEDGKRFRVNAYHQKGRMAASLRAIPTSVPDAATLGLPDSVLRLGDTPHGLLLIVGPTGSGKSTTMACLIDRINRSRACRIITVEDPIEYVHEGKKATIDQREVHADTPTFATALRNILRQDPDVILVGELRDLETIQAAITAAETGHLVMATLHTNDAVQAVDRIIDVFPSGQQQQIRAQVAAALVGVVSQRLLVRADGNGLVAAFEVMIATVAIRTMIRDAKMHQAHGVLETKRSEGMFTLDHSLNQLLSDGIISRDEALRYGRNLKIQGL